MPERLTALQTILDPAFRGLRETAGPMASTMINPPIVSRFDNLFDLQIEYYQRPAR
jgi:hypothetical protein